MVRKNGFAPLEIGILLAVVAMLVLGTTVYVVRTKHNYADETVDQTSETSTSGPTAEASPSPAAEQSTPIEEESSEEPTPTAPAETYSPTATPVPVVPTATPRPEPTVTPTPIPPTPTPTPADVAPVLKNLMVDFAPYSNGYAGAFKFEASENQLFYEYGVLVNGSNGPKYLWTFEYHVKKNAPVYVVADGIVQSIAKNDNANDYEILIQPNANSSWQVWYDHVNSVKVSVGQTVSAGKQLGVAGEYSATLSRTELMIRKWDNATQSAYTVCPFEVFDPSLAATYKAKVNKLISDWESFKGGTTIHPNNEYVSPGCFYTQHDE
ncbi:M23 family metallopeptidase [candidate division WWE3 bacterium]|uniref:M23 family metallopeptidase n=1 Tax=candidate division WWE3 bacterium TaxID=2053526 RepID=A0A955LH39_UNCKA|nr:M23 family metallopeptidase [candidate division WWE3 bacterium]